MEEITVKPLEQVDKLQSEAQQLHIRILSNGQLAASALFEFCQGLKKMRDERLYIQLGYDNFEDYAEQAVGIKQRQAYSYISALEKLGPSILQSNAKFGITKLAILAQIKPIELDEFVQEHDVDEMSTRELQETVAKLNAAEEQITFLSTDKKDLQDELSVKEQENEELKQQLESTSSSPSPEAGDVFDEGIEKQIAEAVEQAKKEAEKAHRKELEDIKAQQKKQGKIEIEKAVAEEKEKNELLLSEKQKSDLKLEEALKQAKVNNADPELIKINFMFGDLQVCLKGLIDNVILYSVENPEKAKKLKLAILNVFDGFKKRLES